MKDTSFEKFVWTSMLRYNSERYLFNAHIVREMLGVLNTREMAVLRAEYEGADLDKLALDFGTSRRCLKQAKYAALLKLRNDERLELTCPDFLAMEVERYRSESESKDIIIKNLKERMNSFDSVAASVMESLGLNQLSDGGSPNVDIDSDIEVLGLSARAYNILYRAGYKTIWDICENIQDYETLCRLRNMGSVSVEDVLLRMRVSGYGFWSDAISHSKDNSVGSQVGILSMPSDYGDVLLGFIQGKLLEIERLQKLLATRTETLDKCRLLSEKCSVKAAAFDKIKSRNKYYGQDIAILGLHKCVNAALNKVGINTVNDVLRIDSPDFFRQPRMGRVIMRYVIDSMRSIGFEEWADGMLSNQ